MEDATVEKFEDTKDYEAYTVRIGEKNRIITVATLDDLTASKWFNQVLKRSGKNATVVVGFNAAVCQPIYEKGGLKKSPFDVLEFCFGSDCLLYQWPGTPRALQNFLENRRVKLVGVGMAGIAKELDEQYGLKIANAVEISDEEVIENLKSLELKSYKWFERRTRTWLTLTEEKVKSSTVHCSLCFSTGFDMFSAASSSSLKKKK